MYELLNIQVKDGKQLVSGRELHEFLDVKSRFNDWIKNRINKYGFIDNIDYTKILVQCNRGQNEYDYALTLDTAKELSMVENNDKGRLARRYFIQCEKLSKQLVLYYDEKLVAITDRLERAEKMIELRSKTVFEYGKYIKNKMGITKANGDYQNVKMVLFAELGVSKWEDIDYSLEVITKIDEILGVMKLDKQLSIAS